MAWNDMNMEWDRWWVKKFGFIDLLRNWQTFTKGCRPWSQLASWLSYEEMDTNISGANCAGNCCTSAGTVPL